MKTGMQLLSVASVVCLAPFIAQSQSTMDFESGTTIEVQAGANICADIVTIDGSYLGSGTKCGGILPVELTSFTVTTNLSIVELQWKTATEVNNVEFDVERKSMNNQQSTMSSWSKVGSVAGHGTTNAPHNYSYADNVTSAGIYSYRLKQIGHDGAFIYSEEMQVTVDAPKVFSLAQNYPDPFNPATTIQFTVPSDGRATLKIFNSLGQEVATLVDDNVSAGIYHQVQFNASNLASGTYFSQLEFAGKVQIKKMLLLK